MYYRLRKPVTLLHPSTGLRLALRPGDLYRVNDPLVVEYPKAFRPAAREDKPNGTG